MFKRPQLSNLIYTEKQIIVHGFTSDHIHPGNFKPIDLRKVDYKPNLSLKISNTKIGNYQTAILHKDQSSIYLYFENKTPNLNLTHYWAKMIVSAKTIQCPQCKSFFTKNDQPCKCIQGAPFLNFLDFTLEQIQLVNYKTDNEDSYDCREQILSEFFGGSLHNLALMEPI
jgi:hypothetical protein